VPNELVLQQRHGSAPLLTLHRGECRNVLSADLVDAIAAAYDSAEAATVFARASVPADEPHERAEHVVEPSPERGFDLRQIAERLRNPETREHLSERGLTPATQAGLGPAPRAGLCVARHVAAADSRRRHGRLEEDLARRLLAEHPLDKPGFICAFKAVEPGMSFEYHRSADPREHTHGDVPVTVSHPFFVPARPRKRCSGHPQDCVPC
jgi:hypothetical protein